jgi:DNA-binding transcriptional regulator of glucitol operon
MKGYLESPRYLKSTSIVFSLVLFCFATYLGWHQAANYPALSSHVLVLQATAQQATHF